MKRFLHGLLSPAVLGTLALLALSAMVWWLGPMISVGQSAPLAGLWPRVIVLLLMWALLIRPQQRKDKEHKAMLSQVEKGDAVITTGGLHGRVTGLADDVVTVEIAPNVKVKVSRAAIATRIPGKAEGEKS